MKPSRPPGVRLSGGEFRGRVLAVPKGARPSEGRVREALFSIWGMRLEGARLLDLFAGSGAVALESIGRGALRAVAVEGNPQALETIEANAAKLGKGLIEIRKMTLPAGLGRLAETGERFDLVFADPPYAFNAYTGLLEGIAPLLAEDGEAVIEHSARVQLAAEVGELVRTDVRRYGEIALSFYRKEWSSTPPPGEACAVPGTAAVSAALFAEQPRPAAVETLVISFDMQKDSR